MKYNWDDVIFVIIVISTVVLSILFFISILNSPKTYFPGDYDLEKFRTIASILRAY